MASSANSEAEIFDLAKTQPMADHSNIIMPQKRTSLLDAPVTDNKAYAMESEHLQMPMPPSSMAQGGMPTGGMGTTSMAYQPKV